MEEGDEYDKGRPTKFPRLGVLPSSSPYSAENAHTKFNELLASSFASRLNEHLSNNNNNNKSVDIDSYNRTFGGESNVPEVPVNMSQTDLTNTLEALSILKNRFNRLNELGQWKNAFHEAQNLSTNSNSHNDHQHQPHQAHQQQHTHPQQRELQQPSSPIPVSVSATASSQQSSKQTEQQQQSEHELRMEILKTDLETAKINKETAEINRQIALQKLNSLNS